MSAEELKDAVRTYADEHLPGWESASVPIRIGSLLDGKEERLYVAPIRPTSGPPLLPPLPPAPQS